jgi:hypothetical protein
VEVMVSFCNTGLPGAPALGLLDPAWMRLRLLRTPPEIGAPTGVTGLATGERFVFAIAQAGAGPAELLVLDRADLSLVGRHAFEPGSDPHSLWAAEDALFVVSTGTDELLRLDLDGSEVVSATTVWRPDPGGTRHDVHHLNAVIELGGALLVSGFGPKAGQLWRSAADGFVHDVTADAAVATGIDQPHSPAAVGDRLAYCESRTRSVRVVGEERAARLPGYTRGLCLAGDRLFAATSVGRRVSKSTGLLNNPNDPGEAAGRCTVSRLDPDTLEVEASLDLGHHAREIYDLLPVAGTEGWPVVPPEEHRPLDALWDAQVDRIGRDLVTLLPSGSGVLVLDAGQLGGDLPSDGLRVLRLPGDDDGGPPDDDAAVRALERARRDGASFVAVAWTAFWWFEHYPALTLHLRSRFDCLASDERVVVFDLRDPG